MICLCLTGETRHEWTQQIDRNREYVGMVEMRVDLLRPAERTPTALGAWWEQHGGGLDSILTIRRRRDLGRWEGDEAQRLFLYSRLIPAIMPDYIDIELDRRGNPGWDQLALMFRAQEGTVLRSHHEAEEMPTDLAGTMALLAADPQEIPKLAIPCASTADLVRYLEAISEFRTRMNRRTAVWVGMGEYGRPTRLLPTRIGSLWTYAVEENAVAPGQISVHDLSQLYRINEAQPDWPVFAVVGDPIAHSASPRYHNERFASDGAQALYVPIRIDRFDQFEPLARLLGLSGVSVTVPHKRAALRFAGESEDEARRIGAANTLLYKRGPDGFFWIAANTDVEGFLAPLHTGTPSLDDGNAAAAVIGAGGAARAAVAGLIRLGYRPFVFNRTPERARDLVTDFELPADAAQSLDSGTGITAWMERTGIEPDLIVQTTSAGLDGVTDPMPRYEFGGRETLYEMIYDPLETPVVARARAAGCRVVTGTAMFEAQAAAQYRRFVEIISG